MLLLHSTLLFIAAVTTVWCQVYDDTQRLFNTVLGSSKYHPDVRPVINQSEAVQVYVGFAILSIVEVDDIRQSFVCNGVVTLAWMDERAAWNYEDYGGVQVIHPQPKQIWRPRLVLVNTLGKRDLFEDDFSPLSLSYTGEAYWHPGSLFPTACELDLTKYPFDEQNCHIDMLPMGLAAEELTFIPGAVSTDSYTVNGAWEILGHQVVVGSTSPSDPNNGTINFFEVKFQIKRRPTFFLLNILLPVVLLSFLNIMVFVIPVDSGEKISYGITVLLALTVFISIVSSMLPQSSDNIPLVVIYLFCLLVVSLLTVVVTIVIVFLQHMEEREERSINARRRFKSAIAAVDSMSRPTSPTAGGARGDGTNLNDPLGTDHRNSLQTPSLFQNIDGLQVKRNSWMDVMKAFKEDGGRRKTSLQEDGDDDDDDKDDTDNVVRSNKFKMIGQYIDQISFLVFTIIWVVVTLWIFVSIAT